MTPSIYSLDKIKPEFRGIVQFDLALFSLTGYQTHFGKSDDENGSFRSPWLRPRQSEVKNISTAGN